MSNELKGNPVNDSSEPEEHFSAVHQCSVENQRGCFLPVDVYSNSPLLVLNVTSWNSITASSGSHVIIRSLHIICQILQCGFDTLWRRKIFWEIETKWICCVHISGQYSQAGSTACTDCPPGYACPDTMAANKEACDPGWYATGKATECTPCTAGKYCTDTT